jgi:hypothetical protein
MRSFAHSPAPAAAMDVHTGLDVFGDLDKAHVDGHHDDDLLGAVAGANDESIVRREMGKEHAMAPVVRRPRFERGGGHRRR